MKIEWSVAARKDLDRLFDFLAEVDWRVAEAALDALIKAPFSLLEFPRRGSRVSEFDPREVREFRISKYVLRYELDERVIRVVRIFHAREDRL